MFKLKNFDFSSRFIMTTPTVKEVLNKLETSSMTETIDLLIQHENCLNPNAQSIKSTLTRLRVKHTTLKKSSRKPNGKTALDEFLASSFTFPQFDQAKAENGR